MLRERFRYDKDAEVSACTRRNARYLRLCRSESAHGTQTFRIHYGRNKKPPNIWHKPEVDNSTQNRYTLIDNVKFPYSWGVSGALYLQSAIAGVLPYRGFWNKALPEVSGVEVWVLCNRNLRTVSGQE